jgi:hypothetical protein
MDLGGDRHSAARTYHQLGIVCDRLGQHREAARNVLGGIVAWRQETGLWDTRSFQWLHRERGIIGVDEFSALVKTEVPGELADELGAAIEAATDPEDEMTAD